MGKIARDLSQAQKRNSYPLSVGIKLTQIEEFFKRGFENFVYSIIIILSSINASYSTQLSFIHYSTI